MHEKLEFEQALTRIIAAGDRQALELLKTLTQHQLSYLARRTLDSELDIQSVMIEVYDYVFEHAHEFETHQIGFMHWLMLIVQGKSERHRNPTMKNTYFNRRPDFVAPTAQSVTRGS